MVMFHTTQAEINMTLYIFFVTILYIDGFHEAEIRRVGAGFMIVESSEKVQRHVYECEVGGATCLAMDS